MKCLVVQRRLAGFFSDFNLITAALTYLRENNITDFSFIWNNIYYSTNSHENLFDKFFFKTTEFENYDAVYDIGDIGGTLFKHFNEHEIWVRANETLKHFNYFDNSVYKRCYDQCYKSANTLGIHVRGTDHSAHGGLLDITYYFDQVDAKLSNNKFESIFLATDEYRVVDQFINRYGDIVKVNPNITRSNTQQGVHYSNFTNKEELAEEVLTDAISLSNCDHILITSSNVSGYTLCINPNIGHTYIDRHVEYH
jgi:hypothetical protein